MPIGIKPTHSAATIQCCSDVIASSNRQKSDKMTIAEASKLINAPLPRLKSALKAAKGGGLERALLEVVVSKTVTTRAGAIRWPLRFRALY